ncbi:MAG: hypothetical protein AAF942_00635 [Pseudomonadota bacterium]
MLGRFCALVAVLFVAGCYLPNDFTADIRITPAGNYNLQYTGTLTYLPLLDKLNKGDLSQEESTRQVKAVASDLARDRGFEEVSYVGRGAYFVRYRRVGNILTERSFTFVRMNSRLLSMQRRQDGTIVIFGDKPNTEDVKRIAASGLSMKGILRVQTGAEVLSQNASEIIRATPPVYVWRIDDIEKASPRLVIVARP